MGYCAVSLQLLVILEKCWLEGGGFAFDNWHLLLETDKGLNSLSLGKGDVCEKTQAELLSVTGRWANLFPWHRVKLQAVAQQPHSLATQSQKRTTAKITFGNCLPIVCTNLVWFLECFGLVSEAMLCFTLWSQGTELMAFVPQDKLRARECSSLNWKVLEASWNQCLTSWCSPADWPLVSVDLKQTR